MPTTTGRFTRFATRFGRARQAEDQPDQPRHKAGTVDHCWRERERLCGLRRCDRARGLHRLNRNGCAVDKSADDHGHPEREQHAGRVHPEDGQVGDNEWNECAEIAKGACDLHAIEAVGDLGRNSFLGHVITRAQRV
jgi:hypothetical protein